MGMGYGFVKSFFYFPFPEKRRLSFTFRFSFLTSFTTTTACASLNYINLIGPFKSRPSDPVAHCLDAHWVKTGPAQFIVNQRVPVKHLSKSNFIRLGWIYVNIWALSQCIFGLFSLFPVSFLFVKGRKTKPPFSFYSMINLQVMESGSSNHP